MIINKMDRRGFLGVAMAGALSGCCTTGLCPKRRRRRIAAFDCDVTPPLGTPIYSSFEPLSVIEQPLQAKGVIIDDGRGRYVLCAVDYCELCNNTHARWRAAIAEAAGTEPGNVLLQTVHQHTAPMLDEDSYPFMDAQSSPAIHPSLDSINIPLARLSAAVAEAAGRMRPYNRVGTGQAKAERVASNRRVPLPDGKIGVRFSSCRDPRLVNAPEGLIDPYVKTVTFADDDKPIARLHFYATHPQSFYGDPRASIDFPGMAREWLQQHEGVFQVYFNGCGGNITAGKYNEGTPASRQGLFERLRAAMKESADSTQYADARVASLRSVPLLLTPRTDGDYAEEALGEQMAKADAHPNTRSGAAMFKAFKQRASKPLEVAALEMGDIIILSLPGEVAVEYQLYAQQLRPDKFVAVAAYGDCAPAYVNLDKFDAEGGYEPTASHVVVGSEKKVRQAIRAALSF